MNFFSKRNCLHDHWTWKWDRVLMLIFFSPFGRYGKYAQHATASSCCSSANGVHSSRWHVSASGIFCPYSSSASPGQWGAPCYTTPACICPSWYVACWNYQLRFYNLYVAVGLIQSFVLTFWLYLDDMLVWGGRGIDDFSFSVSPRFDSCFHVLVTFI